MRKRWRWKIAPMVVAIVACSGHEIAVPEVVPPASRSPGPYSVQDITAGIGSSSPWRFNDLGDVLTWAKTIVHDGTPVPIPGGCVALSLNNLSHALCAVDQKQTTHSFAIWNGSAVVPLAGLDTFTAAGFSAWVINDLDEVAAAVHSPAFSNPACPQSTGCIALWKGGQVSFPFAVNASYFTHLTRNRDLLLQLPTPGGTNSPVSLYEANSGSLRAIGMSPSFVSDLNEHGWAVGTRVSRNPDRSTAIISRPAGLLELGSGDASGVNDADVVVGTLDTGPFSWSAGTFTSLRFAASDTNWTVARALEINNRGQILAVADDSAHAKLNRYVVLTPKAP